MWQKARIVDVDNDPRFLHLIGREVWAKCGVKRKQLVANHQGNYRKGDVIEINVLFDEPDGNLVAHPTRCYELLPEFAEDVPLISWQDFLEGKE